MRMSYLRFRALPSLFVAFTILPLHGQAQQQSDGQPFQFTNTALPIEQRVNDLIGRMTLEENGVPGHFCTSSNERDWTKGAEDGEGQEAYT
jgi:hypothetical protein